MRNAFSDALIKIAKNNKRVLLLTGDHGYALFDSFRKECSDQYINCGIAEQNMVGVAAGLAKAGFRPIVYALAAFIPVRVLEQVKMDVCYENLPVIFIGDGAGLVYSHLGSSHQSAEDIACMRVMPNMTILSPADCFEMSTAMHLAYESNGPVYIRMGKSDKLEVHSEPLNYNIGDLVNIKTGEGDIAIIATGSMVSTAIELIPSFPNVEVWSAPCIKPVNKQSIIDICKQKKLVVVLEEHSIYGGLGSAVAEISGENSPVKICLIGINDLFSNLCGSYQYQIKYHGLDTETIINKIFSVL